jgi:hypothetical protein
MRFRRVAGAFLVILLVIAAATGYWIYRQGNAFFSDPALARTNSAYEQAFASPVKQPAIATNSIAFGKMIIETNGTQIVIRMAESAVKKAELPFTVHRTTGTNALAIGDGTIRLAYLLSGWAAPLTNFDYGVRIPGKIYTADLRPMNSNEITLNEWERALEPRGDFPAAKLFFQIRNIPEYNLVRFQVFDGRTKRSLNSGTSSSRSTDSYWVESDIRLWHQTPIEVVSTVAIGPTEVFECKPEPGSELRFPGGALKLIYIVPQRINGWGSSSDGKTNTATLYLNRGEVVGHTNESSFVFSVWPGMTEMPIQLELLDESGKKLDDSGGGSSDQILISSVFEKVDHVKTIRLKYYPHLYRLVWTIPELPGLPEENRNLKNLFDVRVPYMRFRSEWDYQENLKQLVAMDMDPLAITYPNGYFPLTRTNFTPRELLVDMESKLGKPLQLSVNSEKNKIEIRRPPWEILLEKIKKMFKK